MGANKFDKSPSKNSRMRKLGKYIRNQVFLNHICFTIMITTSRKILPVNILIGNK